MKDIKNMQIDDITPESNMNGFIFLAQQGLCTRDDLLDHIETANNKVNEITDNISNLEKSNTESTTLHEVSSDLLKWETYLKQLEEILSDYKNFNKKLVFSNIRALIQKNPDVKIGQIEKEAGIRLGYMSRLEKEGNTSEPSVEFIVTAAKLLKVSLDTLVNVDVTVLTPTEEYLVKFFDKIKKDTIADKLDWEKETSDELNSIETDINGNTYHPLFNLENVFEYNNPNGYPERMSKVVFKSNTFGTDTYINGNCFNLRLKNATFIYLMNICESVPDPRNPKNYAKEVWTWSPNSTPKLLLSSNINNPLSSVVETLYDIVNERSTHPKIESSYKNSFDAFMNDDLSDDEDFNLPF